MYWASLSPGGPAPAATSSTLAVARVLRGNRSGALLERRRLQGSEPLAPISQDDPARLCSRIEPDNDECWGDAPEDDLCWVPPGNDACPGESPQVFEESETHLLMPENSQVVGAKATNKFWNNWVVNTEVDVGGGTLIPGPEMPISPMPYVVRWRTNVGSEGHGGFPTTENAPLLKIAYGEGVILPIEQTGHLTYVAPFQDEMAIGAVENASSFHVKNEFLTGVHVEVLPSDPSNEARIILPIFSGMAYVSARYSGDYFTPSLQIPYWFNFTGFEKVRSGVWNYWGQLHRQWRIYALDEVGEFVGDDFDFRGDGIANRPLNGWIRVAKVNAAGDEQVLDAHAQAIVTGMDLEVDPGGVVRYQFTTAFQAP